MCLNKKSMPRYILELFLTISRELHPLDPLQKTNSYKDARIQDTHSRLRGILKLCRIFSDHNKNYFKRLIGEINRGSELINQKLFIAYNKSEFLFKILSRERAKDKPWIPSGLKQSIKHNYLLCQKCIFDQTGENKTVTEYLTLSGPGGGAQRLGWPNSQLPIRT